MINFYHNDPVFCTPYYMDLDDEDLLSFIRKNQFSPNALWAPDNPVIHCWLANESFHDVKRLMKLIPDRIDPNLCDGDYFGKKSILILLALLTSSGTFASEFIELYQAKLNFDYQDKSGKTALHYAVILGRHDLVKDLIRCGASTTIEDNEGISPFAYLKCADSLIIDTLKSIDIDPSRDTLALKNAIVNNESTNILINGYFLTQNKAQVDSILKKNDLVLIQYIKMNPGSWGGAVGDDTQATHDYLFDIAKAIMKDYTQPLHNVFTPEKCSAEYHREFIERLKKLRERFSGVSILEDCRNGHAIIEQNLGQLINTQPLGTRRL